MPVGAGCHRSCRDVSTRCMLSQLSVTHPRNQTQRRLLLNRPSGSEQTVPESRSELALGFTESHLEVTGLKECSFLALRDNQQRNLFKKHNKRLLGFRWPSHCSCNNPWMSYVQMNQKHALQVISARCTGQMLFQLCPNLTSERLAEMLCQIALGCANPRDKQTLPFVSGMEKFEFYSLRRSKTVTLLMVGLAVALCGPDMKSRVWSSTPEYTWAGAG